MQKDKSVENYVIETLLSLGASKVDDSIKFIKPELQIRHKTGVKYTVDEVDMSDPSSPIVNAYRYDETGSGVVPIQITKKEFKDYDPV
jgi:hypothetical protein